MTAAPLPFRFVRLCKVAEVPAPIFRAGEVQSYFAGHVNPGVSLPVGYWIKGWLVDPPELGKTVKVLRTNRNGVAIPGVFNSSPVTAIPSDTEFHTQNSRYSWAEEQPTKPFAAEVVP